MDHHGGGAMRLRQIGLALMVTGFAFVPVTAAMAQQQDTDVPDVFKDPRDKLTPPATRHSPNRTNPRIGGNGVGDGDSPSPVDASSRSAVPADGTQRRPSTDALETMGSMVLYQAPSAVGSDAPLASLPGMATYSPPSTEGGDDAGVSYPAWWPQ